MQWVASKEDRGSPTESSGGSKVRKKLPMHTQITEKGLAGESWGELPLNDLTYVETVVNISCSLSPSPPPEMDANRKHV